MTPALQVKDASYSWLRKLEANTSTHRHTEYEHGADRTLAKVIVRTKKVDLQWFRDYAPTGMILCNAVENRLSPTTLLDGS
jgi:hypothetical protein